MHLTTGLPPLIGVIENLHMDSYNARAAYRASQQRSLEPEQSPRQAWWESYLNPYRQPLKGENIITGLGLHRAMEDTRAFLREFELLPTIKRTSKPGYIGRDQLEAVTVLREGLLAMPMVREALDAGQPEVSLFSTQDTAWGHLPVKARPDLLSPTIEIHWKTVSRMDFLGEHINKFRYMEALAFYRRVRLLCGLPPVQQAMVFCQTYAPYEIRVIRPSAYFVDEDSKAWKYGTACLNRFAQLLEKFGDGMWPDYRNLPQDVFTGDAGSPKHAVALPASYDKRLAA